MTSDQITQNLTKQTAELKKFFPVQNPMLWEYKPTEDKWTAGQHVIHLVQSTQPLLKALKLPIFLLKWRFGKSNRPSRTYDEVVKRYQEKLAAAGPGVVGPFSRNMPQSNSVEIDIWFNQLERLTQKINQKTSQLSNTQLDTVLLPHPLMGKMTLREMLMWNTYHTKHHLEVLQDKYLNN
jgi:hypothetical protein